MIFQYVSWLKAKIKGKINKTVIVSLAAVAIAAGGLMVFTSSHNGQSGNAGGPLHFLAPALKAADYVTLADTNIYSGLPVGNITSYPANQPQGTAILIPQIHRDPSTEAGDPANDSAQKTQEQIYQIIARLSDKYHLNFVMAEGDLYQAVPYSKIDTLKKKIDYAATFTKQLQLLKTAISKESIDTKTESGLLDQATQYLAAYEREIILQGAPYKLKAEGKNLILFGTENAVTQAKSADIVRNYVYLKDRQGQLSSTGTQSSNGSSSTLMQLYAALMGQNQNHEQFVEADLTSLTTQAKAQGKPALAKALTDVQQAFRQMQSITKEEAASAASTPAPSRQDNPYASINNPQKIQDLMDQAETAIQTTIVDQRNRETAANFADALRNQHQSVGLITFGAEHKDGLVKELNAQGISVIVITPTEVANQSAPQPVPQLSQLPQSPESLLGN